MVVVRVLKSLVSLGIVVSSIGVLIHYSQGKELLMDEITNLSFSEESAPLPHNLSPQISQIIQVVHSWTI